MPKIEAVIFDLDDTLFDCSGQLTAPARRRAATILATQAESENQLCTLQTELAQDLGSTGAIQEIGRRFRIPSQTIDAALQAYNRPGVEPIHPFPDVLPTLEELRKREYRFLVVTSGHPERQREKVQRLNLHPYFQEDHGTLFLHNDRITPHKDNILRLALQHLDLPPVQVLSVGDKLDAEIAASNRLGMPTARILHGRQKDRTPQTPEQHPTFQITHISDLLSILAG